MSIRLKRAYEFAARSDGYRILVDRIWPRGVPREALMLDDWIKDVAPSTGLRKWFKHEQSKWREFKRLYYRELDARPEAVASLLAKCRGQTVTLVFGAKDPTYNHAIALKDYLERRL